MNELVALLGALLPTRNSLILIGLMLRTFSAIAADCVAPLDEFVQDALPIRSPLKLAGPDVTVNAALTLSPGATGPGNVFDDSGPPATTEVHWPVGTPILSFTPGTGVPVVLVNVTV